MNNNMVDNLKLNDTELNRKCKDCIKGCQTCHSFDGETNKKLEPLAPVSSNLWGLSHVPSARGKTYMMIIMDAEMSHKYEAYLADKLNSTTINAFKTFALKLRQQPVKSFVESVWMELLILLPERIIVSKTVSSMKSQHLILLLRMV